ncbi:MAG: 6-carboxytetrahydropterin synthase [Planctomycetota bacterium]
MHAYELLLVSEFTAEHRLKSADGEYEPRHSHNWRVEVFLRSTGDLDDAGVVADFQGLQHDISKITEGLNNERLDELSPFAECNPSTELIAKHIHDRFAPALPSSVRVSKVRVWETPRCAAAYVPLG